MSPPEKPTNMSVDFARAAKVIPLLEKDLSLLDRATENYEKNFLRFKVKFLSLFHGDYENVQPNPKRPMNQAAEGPELSHLSRLYDLVSSEENFVTLLRRLEQNNERLRAACGLLAAYTKQFQE